ncbi:MAG: PaaI family thioesterase [Solirubrobacterales bacterium]
MSATTATEIWREPARGGYPEAWMLSLSGAERYRAWGRGLGPAPPLYYLTGADFVGFGDGTSEARMPASPWLANSAGLLSGGTLAILADIAFGSSVETKLPAATPYTTAELSLTFLAPARPGPTTEPDQPGGSLAAHGQALHVGRRVGLSEAFILDQSGERLLAHGTSRLSIMPQLDGLPPMPEDPPVHPLGSSETDPFRRPPPTDAVLPQQAFEALGGREILERQLRGDLPPPAIHHLTGIRPTEVGDGSCAHVMPASEWLQSPARRLQGGTIAMLADAGLLAAIWTTTPAGTAIAGLDLKVNFLRPVTGDGADLVCRAEVEHAGRTLAIARARVENAEGKPVLLATGSAMYLPGRAASLAAEDELSASGTARVADLEG